MKKIILSSILLLFCGGLFAQPYQLQFIGRNVDFIQHSVARYSSGHSVIAGTLTPGLATGNSDILVLMTDNSANILWVKIIDYGQDEFVGSVMVDAASNIVLTGYTGTNNTASKNLIVVKLNGNGNYVSDMEITDPGASGYGLYGFDIEQTGGNDYIIVGTGVDNTTLSANKYAFVMRLDYNLGSIDWVRTYNSTGGPATNFDSFNHILKVPIFGEAYLLSGSGVDGTNNSQMAVVDLIDPLGNSLWGNTYIGSTGEPYKASMALYNNADDEFYVMLSGMGNITTRTGIQVLDGSTGNTNNEWTIENSQNNNIINGMAWSMSGLQDEIIFSGYEASIFSPFTGRPINFSLDIPSGTSFNWEYVHPASFNSSSLMSIPFDYIVQPLHNTFGGHRSQYFYQPKALVRDAASAGPKTFRFAAPMDNMPFGLNFLSVGPAGKGGCMMDKTLNLPTYSWNPGSGFTSSAHSFALVGPGAAISSIDVGNQVSCGTPPTPQGRMQNEKFMGKGQIQLYPNPVNDILYVSGLAGTGNLPAGQAGATIALYDLQGRAVLSRLQQAQPDNSVSLDVSTLESGVYFLNVSRGGEDVFVEKILKE